MQRLFRDLPDSEFDRFLRLLDLRRRIDRTVTIYGNRLNGDVGNRILDAIDAGELRFSDSQERVLNAWRRSPFGF